MALPPFVLRGEGPHSRALLRMFISSRPPHFPHFFRLPSRGRLQERFTALNERVQHDLQDMEREFQLEKERKQLQVMRGLLRKAFPEIEVSCERCHQQRPHA